MPWLASHGRCAVDIQQHDDFVSCLCEQPLHASTSFMRWWLWHYQGIVAELTTSLLLSGLGSSLACVIIASASATYAIVSYHQACLHTSNCEMQHMQMGLQHDLANAACSCYKQDEMFCLRCASICYDYLLHCFNIKSTCTHIYSYMPLQENCHLLKHGVHSWI